MVENPGIDPGTSYMSSIMDLKKYGGESGYRSRYLSHVKHYGFKEIWFGESGSVSSHWQRSQVSSHISFSVWYVIWYDYMDILDILLDLKKRRKKKAWLVSLWIAKW